MYTRPLPRRNSKWRPSPSGRHQLHTPRGVQQNLQRGPFWSRLLSPPGHEQARKWEAAALGKGAIGAADAAPPSRRRTRRELARPSPGPPTHRGALAAQIGRPGLPRSSRRPGRRNQAAGGRLSGCFELAGDGALRSSDRPGRHFGSSSLRETTLRQ
ncbi:hypothetical protein NDU88_005786 [Pleurodeles waltl]|uniref:Uncharacterized protein n=1 Tax=Pleurodeles waltl TaxID=8319 RepID=A0AAV7LM65_PLEWA|nr:hypothetical protein NDU88_005786 [Pleurodeles waltl]